MGKHQQGHKEHHLVVPPDLSAAQEVCWHHSRTIQGLAGEFHTFVSSHGYKYVLAVICIFSHCTGAFPCRKVTASSLKSFEVGLFPLGEYRGDQETHIPGPVSVRRMWAMRPVLHVFAR